MYARPDGLPLCISRVRFIDVTVAVLSKSQSPFARPRRIQIARILRIFRLSLVCKPPCACAAFLVIYSRNYLESCFCFFHYTEARSDYAQSPTRSSDLTLCYACNGACLNSVIPAPKSKTRAVALACIQYFRWRPYNTTDLQDQHHTRKFLGLIRPSSRCFQDL